MPTQPVYNEVELLHRIAEGDERSFNELIDHYSSTVYGYLLKYTKDAGLAEELSQDLFLKLWKLRENLPAIENFPGYIYTSLRNAAFNVLRSRLYASPLPPEDMLTNILHQPDAHLEYKQLAEALTKGIELLPPRRREVFMLSRFQGLSYEEIAVQMNIAKSTVQDHIVASLAFLRNYLKEDWGVIVLLLTGFFKYFL